MSSTIVTIATTVGLSTVVSAIVTKYIDHRWERSAARWEMKRATCLRTLSIVDAIWSNTKWTNCEPFLIF